VDNPVYNLVLTVLATARLTRFITTDTLGHWLIVKRLRVWALPGHAIHGWTTGDGKPARAEVIVDHVWDGIDPEVEGRRVKLVSGLDCPFCVGFWIGAGVLLSLAIARAVPPLLPVWRFVMGALSLNYVVGHVSSRIDG
jgi:hypothetical protein